MVSSLAIAPSPRVAWHPVCMFWSVRSRTGRSALVRGRPVAVFRLDDDGAGPPMLVAVGDRDPSDPSHRVSEGRLDLAASSPVVVGASGHRIDLWSGRRLDDPDEPGVEVWPVRVRAGWVEVGAEPRHDSSGG